MEVEELMRKFIAEMRLVGGQRDDGDVVSFLWTCGGGTSDI